MKRSILPQCLFAASIVVGSIAATQAQDITATQLFHGGSRCDHVLHLMHRYGVNNSVNYVASNSLLHHSPLGAMAINEADLGDLRIVQVSQIEHLDAACGPKFAVLVQNHSCRNVCKLHVSAVGVLGRICPVSPSATVAIEQIGAGETLQVEVTLPIEALAMGNRNGQIIGLQRLVVAIDSFDQLVESNEANNLKAFDLTEIPILTPTVEQPADAVGGLPVGAEVVPAPAVTEASPGPAGVPSQAVQPNADPLRSAIQQLAADPATEAATVANP
jgi:hypothetical protein